MKTYLSINNSETEMTMPPVCPHGLSIKPAKPVGPDPKLVST